MASALAAAHKAGIVHRDFKPDNVFIVPDSEVASGERVKILDFGIAKLTSEDASISKTRSGVMMGSPLYMSPEQCRGGSSQVDARADVYALGCVLFHMLTGRPPFDGVGVGDVLGKHQYEAPQAPSVARAGLSTTLDALVLRCLAKEPEERFASMREVIGEIDALSPAVSQEDALPSAGGLPLQAPAPAPAAILTKTTLANTAREVDLDYDPSRRSPLQTVGALLLIAVLGLGGYLLFSSQSNTPRAASASDGAPALATAPPATAPPATAPPARGDAAPATSAEGVDLDLVTTPTGAQIYRKGSDTPLGRTPFRARFEVEAFPATLVVRMEGYDDKEVEIRGPQDAKQSLRLQKIRALKNEAKPTAKPAAAAHDAKKPTPVRVPKPKPPAPVLDDDDALNPFGP
jgi:serine/threonine-protein kinase